MPTEASAPGSHGNSVQTSARLLLALSCDIRSTARRLCHAHLSSNLSSSGLDTQEPPTPLGTTAQGHGAYHRRTHATSLLDSRCCKGYFFFQVFCAAQKYCSKIQFFESPPELSFSTVMLVLFFDSGIVPFAPRIRSKTNCSLPKVALPILAHQRTRIGGSLNAARSVLNRPILGYSALFGGNLAACDLARRILSRAVHLCQ